MSRFSLRLDKFWNLDWEIWWNWLTIDWDQDKLSRFAKNVMSQQISQSRSRLLGLEGGVETKSRFLNLDRDILIVETNFLKVSRFSRLLRPALCQCRNWESWSRHDRGKLRPPGLVFFSIFLYPSVDWCVVARKWKLKTKFLAFSI